jgi:hypothetical protein
MSDIDFASQFAALSQAAARLNAESDSINKLTEQFQDKLRALNVGLEAWVVLQAEPGSVIVPGPRLSARAAPPTTARVETSLGYARGDDGWGLYIKCVAYKPSTPNPLLPVADEPITVYKWTKLVDASRAIRVEALGAFPKLLEALKTAAESAVQAIENAKKFVR